MKRSLSFLIALCLMLSALPALADAEPSTAVITIDGVRTAFFDESGAYLSPLEQDGLVYVPALSLAESLGLDVTADADTLAVTVNGVRTAFFGDDGGYLSPLNVDGVVYVPLAAFAESAGVALSEEGETYALEREGAAQPQQPEPTAQQSLEMYGNVPLTIDNVEDYFSFSQTYSAPQGNPDPYRITYTLFISPTTSYDLVNVQMTFPDYGNVRIIPGEQTKAQYSTETAVKDDPWAATREEMYAELTISQPIHPTSVSGSMRMSKAEADIANEYSYQRAVLIMELASSSDDFKAAADLFEKLASVNYKDSADQAAAARQAQQEAFAREEEERFKAEQEQDEADYRRAVTLMNAGGYDSAKTILKTLADKGYEDSTELLSTIYEHYYQQAVSALDDEDYDAAIEIFRMLEEEGYTDSGDRVKQAEKAKQDAASYKDAVALFDAGRYGEANEAFSKIDGFKDSADYLSEIEGKLVHGEVGSMNCGLATVTVDGKVGFINTKCELAIPCEYDVASYFSEGLACVRKGDKLGFIDTNGDAVTELRYEAINYCYEGIMSGKENGKWQFIDKNGKSITDLKYDAVGNFSEGMCVVEIDGKYGYIDKTGVEVIPIQFENAFAFSEGLGLVVLDGKYGFVNRQGQMVVECQYSDAKTFSEGLAPVKKNNHWDYIDQLGKVVLPKEYVDGNTVRSYYRASWFHCGRAYATIQDVNYDYVNAIIDKTGNMVCDISEFEKVYAYSEDLLLVQKDGKFGFMDTDGEIAIECKYDGVTSAGDLGFHNGFIGVERDGKYGMIDTTGKEVLPCVFDQVATFTDDYCLVRQGEYVAIFDRDLNKVF